MSKKYTNEIDTLYSSIINLIEYLNDNDFDTFEYWINLYNTQYWILWDIELIDKITNNNILSIKFNKILILLKNHNWKQKQYKDELLTLFDRLQNDILKIKTDLIHKQMY